MKNIRLTSYIRDAVISNLTLRLEPEKKKLMKAVDDFGFKVYRATYPEWKHMNRVPEGWLPEFNYVIVYIRGERHQYRLSKSVRLPADDKRRQMPDELLQEAKDLIAREEKYNKDREEARVAARAVLHSVTTLNKLLEVWPEVKQFLPKELTRATTTALAVPIPQLNAMFGIGAR